MSENLNNQVDDFEAALSAADTSDSQPVVETVIEDVAVGTPDALAAIEEEVSGEEASADSTMDAEE